MARKSRSKKQKQAILDAHGGACHICGQIIAEGEPFDVDHIIPLALGGEDGGKNLAPAHPACHRGSGSKTSKDVTQIAKAKRVAKKHRGEHKSRHPIRGGRKLPGARDSAIKMTLSGPVDRKTGKPIGRAPK